MSSSSGGLIGRRLSELRLRNNCNNRSRWRRKRIAFAANHLLPSPPTSTAVSHQAVRSPPGRLSPSTTHLINIADRLQTKYLRSSSVNLGAAPVNWWTASSDHSSTCTGPSIDASSKNELAWSRCHRSCLTRYSLHPTYLLHRIELSPENHQARARRKPRRYTRRRIPSTSPRHTDRW